MYSLVEILCRLTADLIGLLALRFWQRQRLEAENLVLRRQLALYIERGIKPRRVDAASRASLAFLSKLCNWRSCVVVVRPETVIRWHRMGWRLYWRWISRPGRPRIPIFQRELIRRMSRENPLWGEERIANELFLKLGIKLSPRTVRRYMIASPPGKPRGDMRWSTFLRNHAKGIVACDFLVATTIAFRVHYIFVVIHHATRRILHVGITQHPTAAWTLQQLREAIGTETFSHLLHDRDAIFAQFLDASMQGAGLQVIRSPPRSPKANAICERLIGALRRECLDWMIPLSSRHLRAIVREWAGHYNRGRPHSGLGPGIPEGNPTLKKWTATGRIRAEPILGGLHHEYSWA